MQAFDATKFEPMPEAEFEPADEFGAGAGKKRSRARAREKRGSKKRGA
jgi:hypothetical protein